VTTINASARPEKLLALSTSNLLTNVIVDWPATPDTHGADITSYQVLFLESDGTTYTEHLADCDGADTGIRDARTCTIPMSVFREAPYSLSIDDPIIGTITATNDKGTSDTSDPNTVSASVQNVPQAAPVVSRGASTKATEIEVVWSQVTSSPDNGGASILGYKILWDKSGSFASLATVSDPTVLFYKTTDVDQGTPYNFKVLAYNVHGDGVLSDAFAITPAAVPDEPTLLVLESADTTQITFSWTAPYDGGLPITDYYIYWDSGAANDVFAAYITPAVGSDAVTFTASSGLTPGNIYEFKVSALNAIGEGAQSIEQAFIAAEYPGAPQDVEKKSADSTQITVQWTAPATSGGSTVTNYHVYMDSGSGPVRITTDAGTSGALEWTTNAVTPGDSYDFTVSAINGRGEGAQSDPAVSILAATVSTEPLNLRKVSATTARIEIEWDVPANNGFSAVFDYVVYWDEGAQNDAYSILTPSTGNGLTNTVNSGLSGGNYYSFKVLAVNDVGESEFSEVLTVIAGEAPQVPGTPYKFYSDVTEIEIRWTEQNNGGSNITDYKVYWDAGLGTDVFTLVGTTNGYLTYTATDVD